MKERCVWADALRVLASFMVVLLHCSIYGIYLEPHTVTWWFSNAYDAVCHIAVPVFLILSGYFWVGKKRWNIHKIARLVLIYVIWQLFYYVLDGIISGEIRELRNFALGFFRNVFTPYNHLWYLPYLAALWLVAPLITKLPRKVIGILPVVFIAGTSAVTFFSFVSEDNCFAGVALKLIWCEAYFLIGYVIGSLSERKEVPTRDLLCTALIMACLTIIATGFRALSETQPVYVLYEYGMINIAVMSACIFAFFAKAKHPEVLKRMAGLHEYTLGIYLVHIAIRDLLIRALGETGIDMKYVINPLGILFIALITWAVALLIVYIIKKLPLIRETIKL